MAQRFLFCIRDKTPTLTDTYFLVGRVLTKPPLPNQAAIFEGESLPASTAYNHKTTSIPGEATVGRSSLLLLSPFADPWRSVPRYVLVSGVLFSHCVN